MNKFYDTVQDERGVVLPGYRVQVVTQAGDVVDIFADRGGTRFVDGNGNVVNYATADGEGLAEFFYTAADGQIAQILKPNGDLFKSIDGFADNFVLDNLPGNISQAAITGLDTSLAAKADTADLAAASGAALVGTEGRTVASRLSDVVTPEDKGATGDGVADDTAALQSALASGAGGPVVRGVSGKTYDLATWTDYLLTGNTVADLTGASATGVASEVFFDLDGKSLRLTGGEISGFGTFLGDGNSVGTPLTFILDKATLSGGQLAGINIESPHDQMSITGCAFNGNKGFQIRQGVDDETRQDDWKGLYVAGTVFHDITKRDDDASTTSLTAVFAYGKGAQIIGNHVYGLTFGPAAENSYVYTKSIGAAVLGGYYSGATGTITTGRFHGINIKGAARTAATGKPFGYGASAIGAAVRGDAGDNTITIQQQCDETAVIGCWGDLSGKGIEVSGDGSHSVNAFNRIRGTDTNPNDAFTAPALGEKAVHFGNILSNFGKGLNYTIGAGNFSDLLVGGGFTSANGNDPASIAIDIGATDADGFSNISVIDHTFDGHGSGGKFENVNGLYLRNLTFKNNTTVDGASGQGFTFLTTKNVHGDGMQRKYLQTPGASATSLFEFQIGTENCGIATVDLASRRTDGSAHETITARVPFFRNGTGTTIGTVTLTKDFGTAITVGAIVVSGSKIRIRVTGISGQTWDHFAVLSLVMR